MDRSDAARGAAAARLEPSAAGSAGGVARRPQPANVDVRSPGAELDIWRPVLRMLGVPSDALQGVAGRARTNATSFEVELLVSGLCDEETFYRTVAHVLGLRFAAEIAPDALVIDDRRALALLRLPGGPRLVRMLADNGGGLVAVAPDAAGFRRLRTRLETDPGLADRLCITTPARLRCAAEARCLHLAEQRARSDLFDALPYCSSRIVATGVQGLAAGGVLAVLVPALMLAPQATTLVAHLLVSLFFLGCVVLRLAAAGNAGGQPRSGLKRPDPAALPRYSVLVALYREAAMVPELLQALGRLAWPRSKLEIKLVCEVDDRETLEALDAHSLRPWVEIVSVPPSLPRTKPKALAHALQFASGDLVALYDAEDKPHPFQLFEAFQRFEESDPALACVQAPLAISNGDRGILPRMFAFEYAGLFRGILPYLSERSLILPLGGTSNHFRRSALEKMGGWDPYNVTEDADLGLRMCRFGYRTETIDLPTYETAPENWTDWRNQRTRWFKGWIQTWLVHMRDPVRLARELGLRSFLVSQILFAGMVASALVHPLLLVTIGWLAVTIALDGAGTMFQPALIGLDLANIVAGYAAFFLLGRATLPRSERRRLWVVALFTPVYWFMQSYAAWRAAAQLWRDPHLWEKTPHPAAGRPAAA